MGLWSLANGRAPSWHEGRRRRSDLRTFVLASHIVGRTPSTSTRIPCISHALKLPLLLADRPESWAGDGTKVVVQGTPTKIPHAYPSSPSLSMPNHASPIGLCLIQSRALAYHDDMDSMVAHHSIPSVRASWRSASNVQKAAVSWGAFRR